MQRTELLMPIVATPNEIIAMSAAITSYQKWLASTPQSAAQHRETIALLDRFQRRLTLAAGPVLREEEPPCHNSSI